MIIMVRSVMKDYCCFSQTEISELVNLFFGKKFLAVVLVMKT